MRENMTPLYSSLCRRANLPLLRMHMPGHKGKALLPSCFGAVAALDFTELPGTGNLYEGTPPVSEAEALAAEAYGADGCYFLTGGSTQGICAALALCCPPGSRLLLDRGSHRAVYDAMALLDLIPQYLYPQILPGYHVSKGISPEAVRDALRRDPGLRCVCVTSPTYYGVCSDIAAISAVTREYGAYLVVDEAHGAHLPFLTGEPCAQGRGADVSVTSVHKTLPALGSGALLFASRIFESPRVRKMTALFGSSSPSYPVMASLDWARGYMDGPGREEYCRAVHTLDQIRREILSRGVFSALCGMALPESERSGIAFDPARLVVNTRKGNLGGIEASRLMADMHGVVCEMADTDNIVCIITCADTDEEMEHLGRSIAALEKASPLTPDKQIRIPRLPRPGVLLSPRRAALSDTEALPLYKAVGEIAAEPIAPYPPGIPVVAPGEEIGEISLAYLREIGYTIDRRILIVRRTKDPPAGSD